MALGRDTHPGIRDGEVGLRNLGGSDILDRIALMLGSGSIEGILQLHIGIQRIILRSGLLLGNTII